MFIRRKVLRSRTLHRHTAGSRASAKSIHKPARSLRQFASLLSTFPPLAGVAAETSRSIKPRERDLRDLRLFVLARFLTRPTNHPRHAACASNFKSKPVRPRKFRIDNIQPGRKFANRCFGAMPLQLCQGGMRHSPKRKKPALLLVVNFHQTDTGLVVLSGNDYGVAAGRKVDRDGRFEIVRRGQGIAPN